MRKNHKKAEYTRIRGDSGQRRRILAVGLALGFLAFIPMAVRLYNLMVVNYGYYADLALKNQTRVTQVTADRGVIYDRNMNILACSQGVDTVYLNPHELKQSKADLEAVSQKLGEILQLDRQWILEQSKDITKRYKQIAARVDEETATQIREYMLSEKISGIHLEPNSKRYYPYGSLASQVLGFTNISNTGSEGIEAAYNSFLEGSAGSVITTKGNNEMDMPFSYENFLQTREGCSVITTLDVTVQTCLEKQLKNAMDRYQVQNGAFGMVMNVKTGEILAMATLGGYDPNAYLEIYDEDTREEVENLRLATIENPEDTNKKKAYQEALQTARLKQWRNRCISDGYEPGSTFKVLTMAAALDCGAIDLETSFHCGGAEQIPGRSQRLHCWRSTGHGAEKTPQALQNSCNIAFAHIALKLGGERFYDYVKNFGILEKTGIDLAGESKGVFFDKALVTDTEKWGTASLTSGSFGQTFKLTPIQLVRAIASVVNGGYLMEPYLVGEVVNADGETVLKQEPTVLRQVIREETSKTMCDLIASVVEEGTAKNAAVSGYLVGGKTGTSEKIDVLDSNGNKTLDKIVSFVGIAPMDNPEYIVLVALDTPSRSTGMYISGGAMAAPTAGGVLGDILPYLGVSQNYKEDDVAGKTVILEDFTGLTREEAEKVLKNLGLTGKFQGEEEQITAQIPEAGKGVPGNSQVLLYFGDAPQEVTVTVPDFIGMTKQKAIALAEKTGLYILAAGNPDDNPNIKVTAQSVEKDRKVAPGTTVRLEFVDTKAN